MARIKVAGVVDRLPQGALRAAPTKAPESPERPMGRPRKTPETKAKQVTVTLWPGELAALEQLRAGVNEGLPAEVSRSDLARLAFTMLLELPPKAVRQRMADLRK
jgi:hypothetical protein